jgi:hypothetical protein
MGQSLFMRDNKVLDTLDIAQDDNGDAFLVEYIKTFTVLIAISNASPAVKTFVDGDVTLVGDLIAIASHGYLTGLKVALTTSGALPTGLSAGNYYVIKVDANTIKLASSVANAIAGTAVDITAAAGGGTHTLTPAALSGTVKLQASNDIAANGTPTNWADIPNKSSSFSSGAYVLLGDIDPGYKWLRVVHTLAAGQINSVVTLCTKGA